MNPYQEMHDIGKDPVRVNILADKLFHVYRDELTDWEVDFLENMCTWRGPEPLTTRQCEKLVELRDNMVKRSSVAGFSVKRLIEGCWIARLDLSDEDMDFIERVKGKVELRRRDLLRLLHCSRSVDLVEGYVDMD